MEDKKVYYPGEIYKGTGVPSEKNFSPCKPKTIVLVEQPKEPENLPVTIAPLPEPPVKEEKPLEDEDYYVLIEIGKKLGFEKRMKKPALIAAIREARSANASRQPDK